MTAISVSGSSPRDKARPDAAVRHVERNAARERVVRHAARWPWSRSEAQCTGRPLAGDSFLPKLKTAIRRRRRLLPRGRPRKEA